MFEDEKGVLADGAGTNYARHTQFGAAGQRLQAVSLGREHIDEFAPILLYEPFAVVGFRNERTRNRSASNVDQSPDRATTPGEFIDRLVQSGVE